MRPSPALGRRVPVVTAVLLVFLAGLFARGATPSNSTPRSADTGVRAVASSQADTTKDDTARDRSGKDDPAPRVRPATPSVPSGDAPALLPGSPTGVILLGLASTPPEPPPPVQVGVSTPPEGGPSPGVHATTSGTYASRAPPSSARTSADRAL